MGKIFQSITETIGSTPLVKIRKMGSGKADILAKCESFNPLSSVKDRIAISMIESAEKAGSISADTLIVEPTSGNTGIGLAFVCAAKGYKLKLVMPESMSIERRKVLKMLGAELVLTPGEKGMKGAVEAAEELSKKNANIFIPQQFQNPSNPEVHRRTTAEEIWADTDGKVDILAAGVGTGGTITGVGEILKKKNPSIQIVAVEPDSSAVLSGEDPGPHKIQGIGAGFLPDILNTSVIDEIFRVSNEDAMNASRQMARKEGILGGISAGAALYASCELSKRSENEGKTIVFIMCDTGERYISTELFEGLD